MTTRDAESPALALRKRLRFDRYVLDVERRCLVLQGRAVAGPVYRGARLARMRCSVRRCMLSRRAVSETLRSHSS
jgi:hypothetical protein